MICPGSHLKTKVVAWSLEVRHITSVPFAVLTPSECESRRVRIQGECALDWEAVLEGQKAGSFDMEIQVLGHSQQDTGFGSVAPSTSGCQRSS